MSNPVMPGDRQVKLTYTPIAKAAEEGVMTISSKANPSKSFTAALSDIPPALQAHIMLFGVKNLLSDRVAQIADVGEKLREMQAIWDNIKAGIWSERKPAEQDNGLSQTHEDFVTAVHTMLKTDPDALRGSLLAMDPDARKKYVKDKSAHPAVKVQLATIAAERARERAKELARAAKGGASTEAAFAL